MGHLRKLGPRRWQARYRDPTNRERARNFSRETDALRFLAAIESKKATGEWVDPRLSRTPFEEYADQWLDTVSHLRHGPRVNLDSRLRRHILPFFGPMALGSIRPMHVRSWVADMSAKGLAPATINAAYRPLARILKTAVIDGYIARSPCIGIQLPKETAREEMHFLEPHEIAKLADAIDPRHRALIFAAAYTGLRWGELAGLKHERMNLLRASLDVSEALTEVNGRLQLGPTKTGARRALPLPRFYATSSASTSAAT